MNTTQMTTPLTTRRIIANLFVEPGALIRLSIPFLTMVIVFTGFMFVIYLELANALKRAQEASANSAAISALQETFSQIVLAGSVGLGVLYLVCFGYWIVYSHRIFGPVVPIRRTIQKLTSGDYSTRINLRLSDEFKNIADDLNHLAEALEKRKK